MKKIALFGLLAASACLTGCSFGPPTLAYSASERNAMIGRTWKIDALEAVDDFDSALLLRPPSRMTIWHVR